MDQGIPVLAAASGTVTWTRFDQFDRNYWTPYIGEPNRINILHSDGSNSQYWHMRTFSIAVEPGEVVEAGQFLGYIGSSGSSPIPHLHFELLENVNGTLQTRDPFEGDCHSQTSLWLESYDYPGDTPIEILDADIFNKTNLSGVEGNNYIGELALKDRPFRPYVFEAGSTSLYAPRFHPLAGRSFRINGSIQTDQLQMSGLGGAVTYSVINEPMGVSLDNEVVTIPANSSQPFRNAFFQVYATDIWGYEDTMFYHLVDMSKPLNSISTGISDVPVPGDIHFKLTPNPTISNVVFEYELKEVAEVSFFLTDVNGKFIYKIEELESGSGRYKKTVTLDRLNLSQGIYFCSLSVDEILISKKLIIF